MEGCDRVYLPICHQIFLMKRCFDGIDGVRRQACVMLMRMIDFRSTFPLARQLVFVNNELQIFCAGVSAVQRLAENIILILNNFNETEKICTQKVFNGRSCFTIIACHRSAKCYNFYIYRHSKNMPYYPIISHCTIPFKFQ